MLGLPKGFVHSYDCSDAKDDFYEEKIIPFPFEWYPDSKQAEEFSRLLGTPMSADESLPMLFSFVIPVYIWFITKYIPAAKFRLDVELFRKFINMSDFFLKRLLPLNCLGASYSTDYNNLQKCMRDQMRKTQTIISERRDSLSSRGLLESDSLVKTVTLIWRNQLNGEKSKVSLERLLKYLIEYAAEASIKNVDPQKGMHEIHSVKRTYHLIKPYKAEPNERRPFLSR